MWHLYEVLIHPKIIATCFSSYMISMNLIRDLLFEFITSFCPYRA